jgi:uncharacterized protein YegJ (DUF2314 family)
MATRIAAIVLFSSAALIFTAANSNEFAALSQQATRNANTKVGFHYQNEIFVNAIDRAFGAALIACTKTSPDTVEPGDVIFIIAADGRVKKVLGSPNVPLAKCMAERLQNVSRVPAPPGDSWVAAIGVAKHDNPSGWKGTPDRPKQLQTAQQQSAYDKAIAPYVAKARATYPEAKRRFLTGLPKGYHFAVRVRLGDKGHGGFEDAFIRVEKISNGEITGVIENEIGIVKNYKKGQRIAISENKIDNWVIVKPDGSEEGNYVGKFLDHYDPR